MTWGCDPNNPDLFLVVCFAELFFFFRRRRRRRIATQRHERVAAQRHAPAVATDQLVAPDPRKWSGVIRPRAPPFLERP